MSSYLVAKASAAWTSTSGRTNTFLLHLTRVLSTPGSVDTALLTVCYTLTLLHSQLRRILELRYERLALALAAKASDAMLPGETVIASIEPPASRLADTAASVNALAEVISDFRIFARLWGLLAIYTWARSTYYTPPRDAVIKTIVWAQVVVNGAFQFLENGAYLTSKGVLRSERWKEREPKWWVWSSRFWMAHVLLEFLRLMRVRQLKYNEDFGAQEMDDTRSREEEDKVVQTESKKLENKWWNDFYANAGWFPLTVHWSTYDGCVPEHWIGACGMIPGIIGLKELWKQTA